MIIAVTVTVQIFRPRRRRDLHTWPGLVVLAARRRARGAAGAHERARGGVSRRRDGVSVGDRTL